MFGLDILIFTKLMIYIFFELKKRLNSRNNGYIYGICNIIIIFLFLDALSLGLN